jgi:hypothetical protein
MLQRRGEEGGWLRKNNTHMHIYIGVYTYIYIYIHIHTHIYIQYKHDHIHIYIEDVGAVVGLFDGTQGMRGEKEDDRQ